MKLYVARHGQTNYNDLGLCNSDPKTDVHLTQAGHAQAENLSRKLKTVQLDQLFVSELKRTFETANIVNKCHDVPIAVDSRLNDNRSGFENKSSLAYIAALDAVDDKWTVRLNGGESLDDVKDRARSFLDDLTTQEYGSVLIVTHKVIVQAIYGILNNRSNQEAWDYAVDQASCTEFELIQARQ
jgi:broad specificity phosphatase PhoE